MPCINGRSQIMNATVTQNKDSLKFSVDCTDIKIEMSDSGGLRKGLTEKSVEDEDEKEELVVEYKKEEEEDVVPIDRGWAWIVLLGAVISLMLSVGLMKSSGIIFIAIQQRFDSNSSMTSLISTVQNAVYSISALLVMTVGTKLTSRRKLVMIGATGSCLAYVISSQATDARLLLFSHGVLLGMFTSFVIPNTSVMVGLYFNKRRGFANSIAVSGGSLGGLIYAPFITVLLETFGYQGCFLILGGVLFNICISGALFRSQSFYTKHKRKRTENNKIQNTDFAEQESLLEHDKTDKANGLHVPFNKQISVVSEISSEYIPVLTRKIWKEDTHQQSNGNLTIVIAKEISPVMINDLAQLSKSSADLLIPNSRQRTYTETSVSRFVNGLTHSKVDPDKIASKELITGSMLDINMHDDIVSQSVTKEPYSEKKTKKLSILKTVTKLLDFNLFKRPLFVLMMISAGLNCSGNALAPVYVAPYAKEVGMSAGQIAQLLTIFSAIDMCSRILVGVISDRNWVRRSNLVAICSLVSSVTSHLMRYFVSFPLLLIYVVAIGLFSGVYFSLFAVVIVDYLGIAKLQPGIGFVTMFHGTFVAITFYVAGYLRDVTGSYIATFHLLGTMTASGAALMLLLPMLENTKIERKWLETETVISADDR